MTGTEVLAVLPILWVAGAAVVLLPLAAFHRSSRLALWVSLLGFAGAAASLWVAAGVAPLRVTPLLLVDWFALFFQGLFLAAGAAVAILARDYMERMGVIRAEELFALLLLAVAGSMVLVSTDHLTGFFLGLETLSVALYGMVSYLHDGEMGLEAGIKYLVLAGASSAFLLFGIALLYLEWGTLSLSGLPTAALTVQWSPVVLGGTALLIVGISFKLALVPFHLWTPDVYQGAPAPVTAFLATVSKGAVLAFLLRVATTVPGFQDSPLWMALAILAAASMVTGNLLALLQDDVKRILAYSSIAHLGYLFVPLLAGGVEAIPATAFYLTAYFATTLSAFGVVGALGDEEGEGGNLLRIRGLWWRRPLPAVILSVALFSLAGIPLTAGFIGKFYLLTAGIGRELWALAFFLAATSVVGLFYYLRVMAALFSSPENVGEVLGAAWGGSGSGKAEGAGAETTPGPAPQAGVGRPASPDRLLRPGWATGLVLTVLLLLVVAIGIWPGPLFELVQSGTAVVLQGG